MTSNANPPLKPPATPAYALAQRQKLWTGLATQFRVIRALVVRDMMTRYGRSNIGFLWVVLEPMILTTGVAAIWAITRQSYEHGLHVVSFVISGYMPLTLWRHLSNGGSNLIRQSVPVLYHRRLTLIDVVIARAVTEFISVTLAFFIIYGTLLATGVVEVVDDPGLMLLGWLLLAGIGFAASLVIAGMTEFSEAADRFVQPMQYLLIPLSGAFYMVDWLPPLAQRVVLYNPMIHCYEMFRSGFFGEGVTVHYQIWYPLLWIAVLITVGLKMLDAARETLHAG